MQLAKIQLITIKKPPNQLSNNHGHGLSIEITQIYIENVAAIANSIEIRFTDTLYDQIEANIAKGNEILPI